MNHTTHQLPFLMRAAALAGCLGVAAVLPAATPDWFPLEIGNTWLYRPTAANRINPDFRSIRVHGRQTIGGREYFDVNYFGREVLLRVEPSTGTVFVLDRTSDSEKTWMALGAAVGSSFSTE